MKLSDTIKELNDMDYSQEIAELVFHKETLTEKIQTNRLKKEDKEKLILALEIIQIAEYN